MHRIMWKAYVVVLLCVVAGCALLVPDQSPKRTSEQTQEQRGKLQAAYARATASGTRADEDALVAELRSFAAYAYDKTRTYYQPTKDDIALANEYVDKVAAMLDARSAATPDDGSAVLLEEAELLDIADRVGAAITVTRRALALPGSNRFSVFTRWHGIGWTRKRPDIVLDACRTIGPMSDYSYHLFMLCVRDGANGDEQIGLSWASDADRARYRADKTKNDAASRQLQDQNQREEDRKAARADCRNACVEDYGYCVQRSSSPNYSECLDDRAACFEKCEHVIRFSRQRF